MNWFLFRTQMTGALLLLLLSCEHPVKDSSGDETGKSNFQQIDSEGWTVFVPSSDSRIVYVSKTGNDSTGTWYPADATPDPFHPSDSVNAFASYAAAFAHTRDGYPDWILYKRGETFSDVPGTSIRSGRSVDEPFIIGSFGSDGASPLIRSGRQNAITISRESPSATGTTQYVAILGLQFYAHIRNPEDADFAGYDDAGHGIIISTYNDGNRVNNIRIEGCCISYYRNNVILQSGGGPGTVSDIVLKRNTIVNAYSVTSHSQGLYASGVDRLIVTENVFDHNGWLIQSSGNDRTNGGATFHNHNVYTDGVQNATISGNIFMRASSIGTKLQGNGGIEGLVVDNNLYVDGEIGIESCNNYHENYYRVHNPVVSNNVFCEPGRSNPTLRNVGWGMWIQGWDGGSVFNNLLIGQQGQMFFNLGLRSRGVEIFDNVGLMTTMYGVYHTSGAELSDISIHDNYFEKRGTDNKRLFVSEDTSISGISFSSNEYFSQQPLEFRINSTSYTTDEWAADIEGNARFAQRSFPDTTRNIDTYMESIGEEGTLDNFVLNCRLQERFHWDTRFMASTVNDWLRNGYNISYR